MTLLLLHQLGFGGSEAEPIKFVCITARAAVVPVVAARPDIESVVAASAGVEPVITARPKLCKS